MTDQVRGLKVGGNRTELCKGPVKTFVGLVTKKSLTETLLGV